MPTTGRGPVRPQREQDGPGPRGAHFRVHAASADCAKRFGVGGGAQYPVLGVGLKAGIGGVLLCRDEWPTPKVKDSEDKID